MEHTYAVRHAGEMQIYFAATGAPARNKARASAIWISGVETMPGETAGQSGEGPMPVQWTAHIPQAMQRHGGSIKPQADSRVRRGDEQFPQGHAAAGAAAHA